MVELTLDKKWLGRTGLKTFLDDCLKEMPLFETVRNPMILMFWLWPHQNLCCVVRFAFLQTTDSKGWHVLAESHAMIHRQLIQWSRWQARHTHGHGNFGPRRVLSFALQQSGIVTVVLHITKHPFLNTIRNWQAKNGAPCKFRFWFPTGMDSQDIFCWYVYIQFCLMQEKAVARWTEWACHSGNRMNSNPFWGFHITGPDSQRFGQEVYKYFWVTLDHLVTCMT